MLCKLAKLYAKSANHRNTTLLIRGKARKWHNLNLDVVETLNSIFWEKTFTNVTHCHVSIIVLNFINTSSKPKKCSIVLLLKSTLNLRKLKNNKTEKSWERTKVYQIFEHIIAFRKSGSKIPIRYNKITMQSNLLRLWEDSMTKSFWKSSKISGMWAKIYPIYFYFFRAPNGIQLVNDLIEDRTKYIPCGQFNKDNSCDLPFVHLNEKNENMIHSCALCYFVLSGLINVHLLRKCPLLSFIWNYTEK